MLTDPYHCRYVTRTSYELASIASSLGSKARLVKTKEAFNKALSNQTAKRSAERKCEARRKDRRAHPREDSVLLCDCKHTRLSSFWIREFLFGCVVGLKTTEDPHSTRPRVPYAHRARSRTFFSPRTPTSSDDRTKSLIDDPAASRVDLQEPIIRICTNQTQS